MKIHSSKFEPPHGKTNNLPRRKQRRRSASQISFAVTAKLLSAFGFATRIEQFLFYLNPKFQDSSSFLCSYSSVCVRPVRKPHCWFSHEAAHLVNFLSRYLVEIAGGLGAQAGKIWRIGLLGYNCTPDNVRLVLRALGEGIEHARKTGS